MYTVLPSNQLSQPTVTIAPPSAGAGARTVYTVAFNTSATGGLSAAASSQITITLPADTSLSKLFNSTVTDTTSGKAVGNCFSSSTTVAVATCNVTGASTIAAGDSVSIQLDGVTNPTTATQTATLTVATTSDTAAVRSLPYAVLAAHQISQPTVALSNHGAGVTGVIYTVAFNTSATGGLSATASSQITITLPADTSLSKLFNSTVTDTTSGKAVGNCFSSSTTVAVATCNVTGASTIAAGDAVSIQLDGVTNPTTVSPTDTATVATTSDLTSVASAPYSVGQPTPGPISATGGRSFTGTAPASVSGTVAVFTDPDTLTLASEYGAMINWGDGSASSSGTVSGGSGSFTVSASHTYPNAGSYVITVNVTDQNNAANTATVTDSATISSATTTTTTTTTTQTRPSVSTGAPSVQGTSVAGLSASVDPNGLGTQAHFEYGLDPRFSGGGALVYDQSTAPQTLPGDFAAHAVTATVTGLIPNAVYHVRLIASNSAGTTTGPDQTFATRADPPPPAPVIGKTFNAGPVSGLVLIKLPAGAHISAAGAGGLA